MTTYDHKHLLGGASFKVTSFLLHMYKSSKMCVCFTFTAYNNIKHSLNTRTCSSLLPLRALVCLFHTPTATIHPKGGCGNDTVINALFVIVFAASTISFKNVFFCAFLSHVSDLHLHHHVVYLRDRL